MSPTKRIFLNVAATYPDRAEGDIGHAKLARRSLFALVCALFTSRWILMALGARDFGLYGLVGGIIGFVAFFNSVLSLAVGRCWGADLQERVYVVNRFNDLIVHWVRPHDLKIGVL